jgi:phosphatidate cytidylyltransferase
MVAAILGLFAADHFLATRIAISSLIVLLGLLGWYELAVMSGVASRKSGGGWPLFLIGALATGYFLWLGWWEGATKSAEPLHLSAGIMGLLFLAFLSVVFRPDFEAALKPLLVTILGALLFGFLFSYLLRLYHHPQGTVLALVFFFGAKGNDIVAYFFGRFFGRTRFLKVSPKKTLEGCTAAVVFSVLWFVAAGLVWPETFFRWPLGIPLGIILSISTQVGDLSESLLKRCSQVKDSSSLLPEFGGVLDLIDSVLFSGYLFWIVVAV